MKLAKFTGRKGLVVIGDRPLEPGDIVGGPGSGAPVIGCTGVAEYLLKRRDCSPVDENGAAIEESTGASASVFPDGPVEMDTPFDGIELNAKPPQDLEESHAKVETAARLLDEEE